MEPRNGLRSPFSAWESVEEGLDLKRVAMTYKASFLAKESILISKDVHILLQLDDGIEVEGSIELFLDPNPEIGQKSMAELQIINK